MSFGFSTSGRALTKKTYHCRGPRLFPGSLLSHQLCFGSQRNAGHSASGVNYTAAMAIALMRQMNWKFTHMGGAMNLHGPVTKTAIIKQQKRRCRGCWETGPGRVAAAEYGSELETKWWQDPGIPTLSSHPKKSTLAHACIPLFTALLFTVAQREEHHCEQLITELWALKCWGDKHYVFHHNGKQRT